MLMKGSTPVQGLFNAMFQNTVMPPAPGPATNSLALHAVIGHMATIKYDPNGPRPIGAVPYFGTNRKNPLFLIEVLLTFASKDACEPFFIYCRQIGVEVFWFDAMKMKSVKPPVLASTGLPAASSSAPVPQPGLAVPSVPVLGALPVSSPPASPILPAGTVTSQPLQAAQQLVPPHTTPQVWIAAPGQPVGGLQGPPMGAGGGPPYQGSPYYPPQGYQDQPHSSSSSSSSSGSGSSSYPPPGVYRSGGGGSGEPGMSSLSYDDRNYDRRRREKSPERDGRDRRDDYRGSKRERRD
eukprot:gb/GEZN01004916.1/.p1 GENE.gb/GEZN01004916.1/~~gb/GEZN01004916.1/.p1  ORF type:complete len:295 (-),score=26.36 gb/GEZN01004916.1/:232-1116(-)